MKNLIWMFLVSAVITLSSCGNKINSSATNTDTATVDSVPADSSVVDSL
jgi:predicted small lipoprotein YifL